MAGYHTSLGQCLPAPLQPCHGSGRVGADAQEAKRAGDAGEIKRTGFHEPGGRDWWNTQEMTKIQMEHSMGRIQMAV